MKNIKRSLLIFLQLCFLAACDGGDSDSGGNVEPTLPGTNVPISYVGVYNGTLTVTAKAAGLSQTESYPIKVTVNDNATVRFDGDEPDETFTVGLTNDGDFAGSLQISEDECSGTVAVTGMVDGTTASGKVEGDGKCRVNGINIDVTLEGDFTATK